jgi:leucyl-tRNA synthetase
VVTCVPSDSPDDYITSLDLAKKAAYYSLDPSWIPSEAIPVLSTPTYGNLTAQKLCEEMKIQSPKDLKQLAEAKEVAYKEGFYKGTMIIGPFTGMRVEDAKPKVREMMIAAGDAFAYSEPEGMVMSRSAEECVVALCDQWYLDYGQADWRAKAEKCVIRLVLEQGRRLTVRRLLANMNTYNKETRNGFEQTLAWLRQWACARSYGLGSKLPFAQQFIVESLSDSTIYMAYYTIAHLLHGESKISAPSGN